MQLMQVNAVNAPLIEVSSAQSCNLKAENLENQQLCILSTEDVNFTEMIADLDAFGFKKELMGTIVPFILL